MVDIAVKAIELLIVNKPDKEIELDFLGAPTYKGRTWITADEAVDALHLEQFALIYAARDKEDE